jgi:hypothetical protein
MLLYLLGSISIKYIKSKLYIYIYSFSEVSHDLKRDSDRGREEHPLSKYVNINLR